MKTTSRLALLAASGVLLGVAMTPAQAADLGHGGCCADLEERVAELEATTARKGNRVVSLQVYGQVNKGLLIWDDGIDSDAFVVDNAWSTSRVGFKGKASIKPGWTAGYNVEFEIDDAASSKVTQGKNGDDPDTTGPLVLRQNFFYVESDKLGRLSVGHQSTAADGGTEVVLGNSLSNSNVMVGNKFLVRGKNGASNEISLDKWANNLDAGRDDVIRYDTPSIYGFILSASWGDNDYADVVLRFKKEFGSFRLVAGVGYVWSGTSDTTAIVNNAPAPDHSGNFEEIAGSVSLMHVPTGLYLAFAAADRDFENLNTADKSMWYLQGGIEKKFLPYGSTTVYGEYGVYATNDADEREATRVGFGVVQKIDAAAMDIYAQANFWSFDDNNAATSYEDMSTVMIGSRIQF